MKNNLGSVGACIENGNDPAWCKERCMTIGENSIVEGNSLDLLKCVKTGSVDLLFADEPYNIAGNNPSGITWTENIRGPFTGINARDQPWDVFGDVDFDIFHDTWLAEAKRVLKPGGSLWVSGTYHNIYKLGATLQKKGFHVLNDISWFKRDAPPRSTPRGFSASHETLIWAKPNKKTPHYFDYDFTKHGNFPGDRLKVDGKQMRSVWDIPKVNSSDSFGYTTQKPEKLLERVILSTSRPGDIVLDPFAGSGTTCAVAKRLGRKFVCMDQNPDAITIMEERLK